MEVERVQDGPLKNSEISRFLEASKTSYKAVEGILTDKKEPIFQQRTLIDIASEVQLKNSTLKQEKDLDEIVEDAQSEEPFEEEKEDENSSQKLEQEKEALRLAEEKKFQDEQLALENREKEIYEKGFVEGKVAAEIEATKKLENGLIALENARKSMLDLNASHFINLRNKIASQILKLSSERAGAEIKHLPDGFFNRIETLLEMIGQTTKEPVVFLNPSDLDAIQETISTQKETIGFSFEPSESLMNGDIIIEIGSIHVKDTATERSGLIEDKNSIKTTEQNDKKETDASSKSDKPSKPSNDPGS